MVPDWLARVTTARHAPAVGCALLAAAAAGQAIAQAVMHAQQNHPAAAPGAVPAVEYAMPLVAFALLATLPLLFFRPLAAALAIAAANAASLAWFGIATAAGIAAQLIAGYRLGRQGEPGGPAALRGALPQVVAVGLAVPFAVLALASHGGVTAVLLAWGAPTAAAGSAVGW